MRSTLLLLLAPFGVLAACSTPDDDCVSLDTDCTPQYEPTFDNIHARTIVPGCATGGGSCHASPSALGGFSLAEPDTAYDELSAFTEATDCGVLVSRITSDDPAFQMPPGAPLSAGEQCAILQWVEAGAPR